MTLSRRRFLGISGAGAASLVSHPLIEPLRDWANAIGDRRTDFAALRASIKGSVILPADGGYDRARRVWSFNPRTDVRPAAIVRCAEAADVAKSIAFARTESLDLAIRGGGHDILGASSCEGGLVVDLSGMKRIAVDSVRKTALVEPGVISGELKAAAIPAGLAPVLGCNPSVGVAGLTLGGGIGWFLGTHGAACDNLVSATIATADGALLPASDDSNPDLFWAIRGGGGNFGVAISLEFQLQPVDAVVGGVVAFRQKTIAPFLRFYREFMQAAPDPLTIELSIFADPDPVIWAMVCWNSDAATGLRVLKPLRGFAATIADTIEVVPWSRFLARMPARTFAQTSNTYWRGGTLPVLSDTAIDELSAAVETAPRGWQVGLGHFMHGRICRVESAATPFRRRVGQSTHFVSGRWEAARDGDALMRWVDRTWSALHALGNDGTYVNYLSESSEAAVKETYGEHYPRLAALKRRYDPENVFRRNRNIRPS